MKHTQIHTLFYAINYLKCKVVIFNIVEIYDFSVYSHCLSPFLDSSVQSWTADQCSGDSQQSLPMQPPGLGVSDAGSGFFMYRKSLELTKERHIAEHDNKPLHFKSIGAAFLEECSAQNPNSCGSSLSFYSGGQNWVVSYKTVHGRGVCVEG